MWDWGEIMLVSSETRQKKGWEVELCEMGGDLR